MPPELINVLTPYMCCIEKIISINDLRESKNVDEFKRPLFIQTKLKRKTTKELILENLFIFNRPQSPADCHQ